MFYQTLANSETENVTISHRKVTEKSLVTVVLHLQQEKKIYLPGKLSIELPVEKYWEGTYITGEHETASMCHR